MWFISLLDAARLKVVALVAGVAHREGLAGESTVEHNGAEELMLAHTVEDEANGVLSAGDTACRVFVVDIVDGGFGVLLTELIDKRLKRSDGELLNGRFNTDGSALAGADELNSLGLCVSAKRLTVFTKLENKHLGIGVENDTVDRLEV